MGRFRESDIIQLLELYKSYECLWKSNDRYYKVKSKRAEAYSRIRDAMSLSSILEVKQKLKALRVTYASERSKIRKSAISANYVGDAYKTQLCWYNLADSFLGDIDGRDSLHGSNARETVEYSGRTVRSQTLNTHNRPMKVRNNHYQNIDEHRQSQRNVHSTQDPKQTDEFYHFGMNVAMQLRSLPLVRALDLQAKFQQMLCDVRLTCERNQYESERYTSTSQSLVVENPPTYHESIPFMSSPKEENTIKTEYSIEEMSDGMPPGGL